MSSMTIMQVDGDGNVVSTDHVFKNAWQFYALTWRVLIERYLYNERVQWDDPTCTNYVSFMGIGDSMCKRLWDGVAEGQVLLKPEEHNVLTATYDMVLFRASDVSVLARSMVCFGDLYPDRDGHWHDIGRALITATSAIGFECSITDQWTAVGSYGESTGDYTPYNVLTGDRHWLAEVRGA